MVESPSGELLSGLAPCREALLTTGMRARTRAASTLRAMDRLGYTTLFSTSREETRRHYRMLGDYVSSEALLPSVCAAASPLTPSASLFPCLAVIMEAPDTQACFVDPFCIKNSEEDHLGIPAWKVGLLRARPSLLFRSD